MARVAIGIEYDGSAYAGWQRQQHAPSVQAELERALSQVADHSLHLTAAGRTDAGVHALMQVAHFDTTSTRPDQAWVLGGSALCAPDVGVLWAQQVPDDFHARFSALSRRYVYRIANRRVRPAIDRARACWVRRPLDADVMNTAAQALKGEHDFSAFRAADCQSPTPMRWMIEVAVRRDADRVEIGITANAFLHHMVRNLAGTLISVGVGDRPAGWIAELLASRDRTQAGATAPPHGLYLADVRYEDRWGLPTAATSLR